MEQLFGGFAALPGMFAQGMQFGERSNERERAARIRQEELAAKFGEDAVLDASGSIDVLKSARRQALSQQAAQLGEAEGAMGMSIADANPELRQLPGYRVGAASGMARRAMADQQLENQLAIQRAIQERLMAVQGIKGQQSEAEAISEAWQNMGSALRSRPRPQDIEKPTVTITERVPGGGTVKRSMTEAEYEQEGKRRVAAAIAAFNESIDNQIAGIKASTDKKFVVQTDESGAITARPAGMLNFSGVTKDEAIAALESAKRSSAAGSRNAAPERKPFPDELGFTPGQAAQVTPTNSITPRVMPPAPDAVVRSKVNRTNEFFLPGRGQKLIPMR